MGKLIDADKLKTELTSMSEIDYHFTLNLAPELADGIAALYRGVLRAVDKAPTAEAIPISWLTDQIELASSNGEDDYASALDWTVMKWLTEVEDGTE